MPEMILRYRCPVCDDLFADEDEAKECLRSHNVEEEEIFVCDFCGEEFDDEKDALRHEAGCCTPTCLSCRHCAENRRRWHPCPRPSFDRNMDGCERYERDRDTHVAHA